MVIDKELLDKLSERAKMSGRLRIHYDLRDTPEDGSMRMLNAIEPGTVIPIHRHIMTSEDVVVLRGVAEEIFFDAEGNEIARWVLMPGSPVDGSIPAIHVPMGQYHTCQSKESGTVIIEFKNTKYDPERSEELLRLKE